MSRINQFFVIAATFLAPAIAAAAPAAGAVASPTDGIFAIAMGFGMGLAALGCGMGQGRAAAAALEGICRNPNSAEKVNTPMLLGLAFIESLTIFTFVVAFLIYGKFSV
jgi:F-type H+-transporting ATPase subunit c